ncbi:MAG: tRNA-dihydrouridine synthase [Bdellovibrionales bacterium]|nr:tRNA-dihydrouridine synthase [Bdellovibrionales bacterium]
MEDVTDTVFRRLVASCGAPDVFVSEFTSTDGMFSPGWSNVVHRLKFTEGESPLVAQIWGNKPELYQKAASRIRELGFHGIDINMGCPVEKIIKSGCCSALIDNPSLAAELVLAAKEGAGGLPVSVKTRIGFTTRHTEPWIEHLLSLQPDAITVHGRTAKQLSKGTADWGEIAKCVQLRDEARLETVIIGNGDVKSLEEADLRVAESGADGVMIGRGIFDNLFLFQRGAAPLSERSVSEKLGLLLRHIDLFEETWKGEKPYRVLKKYFKIYASSFDGASQLRMQLVETENAEEARALVDRFLLNSKAHAELNLL